ncbi:MAG: OmpA family protein [Bacteroidales bacterium]|nr:OmpA family protein [Bacteroidales bacterium]
MKKSLLIAGAGVLSLFAAQPASAQETVVVEEESVVVTENVPCQTHYYSTARDNWFIQIGAGVNAPFCENFLASDKQKHHLTVAYNLGFGKWMSPYLGWRISFLGGPLHWDFRKFDKAKYVSANFDLMWDMFNSYRVNSRRVFSIVPFVGLGGTFVWDYKGEPGNILNKHHKVKSNQWCLPVSVGLQLRFRLCKYVDFFAEGRAQFYGDNFNNYASGQPIEANITAIGGFTFNIGGSDFQSYNPCDYLGYINSLNNQVNDLRGELATTAAALAAAEAQLPCPEVVVAEETVTTPLLATVRFKINSDVIQDYEKVNVYNIAEWLKANPTQNVTIAGYADKDTGTAEYNMALSKRRAEAVRSALVNDYGINPDRLSIQAEGSATQPYPANNDWNRIVIFSNK